MSNTRTTEPTTITQGDRVAWTRTFTDYPATLWTLVYLFRGDGYGFDVTADADGTDFDAEITAAQSAAATVTKYRWQARLTEIATPTNTFAIQTGETVVKQGFAAGSTAAVDLRSPNKITLDAIDELLLKNIEDGAQEYELTTPAGTRKVKRRTDLLALRKEFATLVAQENARERARNGGSLGTKIDVRFRDQ